MSRSPHIDDALTAKKKTDFVITAEIIGAQFERLRRIRRGKGKKERGTILFEDLTRVQNELLEEIWTAQIGYDTPMPRKFLK